MRDEGRGTRDESEEARPLSCPIPRPSSLALGWTAVLAGALVLRVAYLGDPPLDVEEGARAVEGWRLWQDGSVGYTAGPLLTNLLSLLFGLFTAGDGQARLPSAVAGTVLVAVPWSLRGLLGAGPALSAALVLAVCPPLVVASRTASPAILVSLFLLAVAVSAYRYAAERRESWLVAASVAVVLGLAADRAFTLGAIGVLLAAAIAEGDQLARPTVPPRMRSALAWALAAGLVAALLVDTRLLMNPSGFQVGLIDPLWRWTADLARGGALVTPPLLALVDGGTFLLAAVGVAQIRHYPRVVRFLGTWTLVAIALAALTRQPDPRYLLQPFLPAGLLAGLGLHQLATTIRRDGDFRSGVFALLALVPLIAAAFRVNSGLRAGGEPWIGAIVVALAGCGILGLAAYNWLGARRIGAALATFVLLVSGISATTTTSRLLEARGSDRAHLLEGTFLTAEVDLVREEALKWWRADPQGPIAVDPTLRPLVQWSLRDIPTVEYAAGVGGAATPRLLAERPQDGTATGRSVRHVVGFRAEGTTMSLRPERLWRWAIGRESLVEVRPRAILVVQPSGS